MKITQIVGIVVLGFTVSAGLSHADQTVARGTSFNAVLSSPVAVNHDGSAPVSLRVTGSGPLASAKLEGVFLSNNPHAWVFVQFSRIVMANGTEMPLQKVAGYDAEGVQAIEMVQTQRSQWAPYVAKSEIPAGTHFTMMLTTNIDVSTKNTLADNR